MPAKKDMQGQFADPIKLARMLWPKVTFYKEQEELIYSVVNNRETICVAGNELGKDFVAAFIVLWFFLTRHPCRVVTTSADYSQLESVLWGEIRRFIQTSAVSLSHTKGGPLMVNHLHIRKLIPGTKEVCGVSYCIGRVAKKGEGMLGHHVTEESGSFLDDGLPRTLFVADEASGVDDTTYGRTRTWADRTLVIGNPFPCSNFFYRKSEEEGDIPYDPENPEKGYFQKIINIEATQSPNVRLAEAERKMGRRPSGRSVVPGVLTDEKYREHLKTWDPIMLCIGVHAKFWKGKEVLLYPPEWLNRANRFATEIYGMRRVCKGIGVDPAEGGDKTAMAAVDEYGLIDLEALKTPDTTVIPGLVLAFARKHNLTEDEADRIVIDRGGGGKQVYDSLRKKGWNVRTIGFGEPIPAAKSRFDTDDEEVEKKELKYVYKNQRAKLYGKLRELLEPSNETGFGIPRGYTDLRKQLAPIPLLYDTEGRMYVPPKRRKTIDQNKLEAPKEKTLTDIIGHSPDEAEAFMLAIYAMTEREEGMEIGPIFKS